MCQCCFDDFISGEIAVVLSTSTQVMKFFDLCERHGLKWHSNNRAKHYNLDFIHNTDIERRLVRIVYDYGGLSYSVSEYGEFDEVPQVEVPFEEILEFRSKDATQPTETVTMEELCAILSIV